MVYKKKSRLKLRFLELLQVMVLPCLFFSCTKADKPEQIIIYNGPMMEVDNVETVYTDSSIRRVKLKAPKQIELQTGNREFPKGVWVQFFDEQGKENATLTSNTGTYYKDKNYYTVRGNVVIKNLKESEQLNTEELHWYPDSAKVSTEKFVRIETPEQILTGEGLDAAQDFSRYKIRKPHAIFSIDEEEEEATEEEATEEDVD